jgi:hypothetical protein
MPKGIELTGMAVRPILGKIDRWTDEADGQHDHELVVPLAAAYNALHEVRQVLRSRAGNGTPAQ